MVRNEGKTFELYNIYRKAGFDPERDMLQVPIFSPEDYTQPPTWWYSKGSYKLRRIGRGGGIVVDWDLRTNLEGLYGAGSVIFGHGDHAGAATSGRYAGRKAAQYASIAEEPKLEMRQVEEQKSFTYNFIKKRDGIRWKELNAGINRVMQDFCSSYKHEKTLNMGLMLLRKLRDEEMTNAYAPNPHELARILECYFLITVGEIVIHTSLARIANDSLDLKKLITIKKVNEEVRFDELPTDYYLKAPFAQSYEENYRKHCGL